VLEADALVGLGRLDEAETVVARVEFRAGERDVPSTRAAAARVRASLLAARGETAHARKAFELALGLAPANQPFHKAVIEMEFGSFLRRMGRRREAQSQLDSARNVLAALRARPYVQRIDRELSALGLAPSRRLSREPTKLTPQETVMVHLAKRGYTNREIASELVISVRTVEYHLTNAYKKLGVTSRRELIKAHAEAQ
jgi:DNA-binding NarL/FixJ family response regulator